MVVDFHKNRQKQCSLIILLMSSKIKAAVRIRPFLKTQIKNGYLNSNIKVNPQRKQVEVFDGSNTKNFNFDYIFDQQVNQEDLYDQCNIDHLIDKTLKGYHSTIFAYGQTGSGKTYTMQGEEGDNSTSGVIPKIFSRLFEQIQANKERSFSVSLSFLQIYNERIFDLLNPAGLSERGGAGLRLRWSKDQQFTVQNLYIFQCLNEDDLKKYFGAGLKNRISASHKLNVQSSRSHSILTIRIESYDRTGASSLLSSKLELVDLAGSERIGQTGTEGKQAKESIDINKSLFTLRQVISILAQSSRTKGQREKSYVPYRDSKLTSILKQSIGGNSYCLMIACICPNDIFLDQNLSTLTYATKASYITNQPTVNDDPRNKVIAELRRQVKGLTEELGKANQHIELLSSISPAQQQHKQQQQQQQQEDMYSEHMVSSSVGNGLRRGMSERTGGGGVGEQFSERLVESINMVRELLKSNKELREKLQQSGQRNEEKDLQIFELTKQNEHIKQKLQGLHQQPVLQSQLGMRTSAALSRKRHVSTKQHIIPSHHHATEQPIGTQNMVSTGNVLGFTAGGSKNNFNYWNSVQINQYYMNERGVDSVPTNFSRKEVVTSQERRLSNSRGGSVGERSGGRNALTAKFNSRNWKNVAENPGKFLSFYQQNDVY